MGTLIALNMLTTSMDSWEVDRAWGRSTMRAFVWWTSIHAICDEAYIQAKRVTDEQIKVTSVPANYNCASIPYLFWLPGPLPRPPFAPHLRNFYRNYSPCSGSSACIRRSLLLFALTELCVLPFPRRHLS